MDFANTAHCYVLDDPQDDLENFSDLITWSQQAGILTAGEARHLLSLSSQRAAHAEATLRKAKALRGVIYRIFSTLARQRNPSKNDLEALNAAISEAMRHARVIRRKGGFIWGWLEAKDRLDQMLWPVVRSAADLLTSGNLERLGECSRETCTWLFMDTSKNKSRRWCDMNVCGNRAKFRRYYERSRSKLSTQ